MTVDKLLNLDRRIIYLLILLSVVLPLIRPVGFPVEPSEPVIEAFRLLEELPADSLILMSFDYGPSTKIELHPTALATCDQILRQNKKVAFMALYPEGQAIIDEVIVTMQRLHPEKSYGVDYVNLGYKAGNETVLVRMGLDFRSQFPTDTRGTPLSDIPMLRRVTQLSQFDMVGTYSSGFPGALEHIRITATQYGRPLVVAATAVMTPQYFPYYDSGQVKGLVGGLRGAAEYEKLTGFQGDATAGMDAQSIAHFTIAGLIIFANVLALIQFLRRRREE